MVLLAASETIMSTNAKAYNDTKLPIPPPV